MDDYLHLNLKKFSGEKEAAEKAESPERPATASSEPRADATEKLPTLSLEDPIAVEDNSDPYNSSGKLNNKVWDG